VVELGGKRLIVSQYQGGAVHRRNDLGNRKGFAGTCDPEQNLMGFALLNSPQKFPDGRHLVAARLVVAGKIEIPGAEIVFHCHSIISVDE